MLLDEPTNHLDLATREALSMALNEFEGTVMLVSHDRALLRSVCDEFWMVGRGVVTPFDGDLDDYQRYLLDESKRLREEAKEAAQEASKAPKLPVVEVKKASTPIEKLRPLKKELTALEAKMAPLSQQKDQLETQLNKSQDPAELADLGRQLQTLHEHLGQMEERWLVLTSELESLS